MVKEKLSILQVATELEQLMSQGNYDQVINFCVGALQENPNNYVLLFFVARALLKKHDYKNSILYLREAFNKGCDNAFILNEMGKHFLIMDSVGEAMVCYEKAEQISPGEYNTIFGIANCYKRANKHIESLEYFETAMKMNRNPGALKGVGMAHFHLEKPDVALQCFEEAEAMNPNDAQIYAFKASALEILGRLDEAEECYLKAVELDEQASAAYYGLSTIKKFDREKDKKLISEIHGLADKKDTFQPIDEASLNFALGNIYDSFGEYDKAFCYYKKGNELLPLSSMGYDVDHVERSGERNIKVFTKEYFEKRKALKTDSNIKPVFILGMARSGSTLTEQILCGHSKIDTVRESDYIGKVISSFKPRATAESKDGLTYFPEIMKYVDAVEEKAAAKLYLDYCEENTNGAEYVINKNPDNYMQLGAIEALFENTVIIDAKRHPLDACMSMYKIFFSSQEMYYSTSFEGLARFYKTYYKMMKHWHEVLPGKIYSSYYEELVNKPEECARALVELCGLEWEEDCMDFHKQKSLVFTASKFQVKNKIYKSSIYKWKNYEEQLAPLKEMLADEIAEYEDEIRRRIGADVN